MPTFWEEFQLSLTLADEENSLTNLVKKIVTRGEINRFLSGDSDKELFRITISLLREKIFSLFLKKLKCCEVIFFKLSPLFDPEKAKLPPHQRISVIRNKLLLHYERSNNLQKEAILFLILLIDILNQNRKEGVKNFIRNYADLEINAREFSEVTDILNISAKEIVNIYLESKILSVHRFMNKSIIIQKRNLLFLLNFWAKFTAPSCYLKLYQPLKLIFQESLKTKNIELSLYLSFFIRFYYGNILLTLEAWKKLDLEVEKPLSDLFLQYCQENKMLPGKQKKKINGKIRIGYGYQQLCPSSPIYVFLSLLKGHLLNKNPGLEFYIYGYDYLEKKGDQERIINTIRSMGFSCISARELGNFRNLSSCSHLEKASALRRRILADKIDIFITVGTPIGNFLVSSRVAPIQIYWSHINPFWNVHNLDYRIIHASIESLTKGLYQGQEYYRFPAPMARELLNPPISADKINRVKTKFPKDKILLGFIGSLHKIKKEEYLSIVSEILKRNPETIFLICGAGDKNPIKKYFEATDAIEKIYFEGMVNSHLYNHIIDLALDSFPNPMGVASLEFFAKAKPMVSLKTKHEEVNKFRLKETQASSKEEYIQIANNLIKDKNYRETVGRKYQEFTNQRLNCQKAAKELEKLYINLKGNE